MAKGGFDTIIDNINKRKEDDVVGIKAKKTESESKPEKKEKGYSLSGMIDTIRDRNEEKLYNRGVYKDDKTSNEKEISDKGTLAGIAIDETAKAADKGESEKKEEPKPKKKVGGSIDSMIDNIRNRDKDDAAGVKSSKK